MKRADSWIRPRRLFGGALSWKGVRGSENGLVLVPVVMFCESLNRVMFRYLLLIALYEYSKL
jgi:hypothetical protein